MSIQKKLLGKTALITGGARGLGRVYALHLAALGADVGIIDIDLRSYRDFAAEQDLMTAETTMAEIIQAGQRSCGREADVSDWEQVSKAVDEIAEELGGIDILVCNAGGGSGGFADNPASDMDLEQYHTIMARNLNGTVYTVKAAVPHMKKKAGGKIVTACSQACLGITRNGTFAHYAIAKAAIMKYTRYLSADLGPYGINVNAIAPGFILTGRIKEYFLNSPDRDKFLEHTSLRRFGTPEDCAKVVEFLVTDLSDFVTGTIIDVTGGTIDKLAF